MSRNRRIPDSRSGGPYFAAFCERYLRHTKGRWAGDALVFEDWQKDFWWEALELDPKTGRRVYQEVGLGLPRKNSKSTMAAGAGLYFLTADGEAEPEVYVGAGAQQQAGIVMRQSLQMARRSVGLAPYLKVQKYLVEAIETGGIMRALASEGALQHGLNPSCNIIDEVHAHKDSTLWTALTTGTGAREQPFTLWITTQGEDEDNLLGDLFGQMTEGPGDLEQRAKGLSIYRDREAGVLIWWYGAPTDADPHDPTWWKAVNPASWLTQDYLRGEYRKLAGRGQLLEWRIFHLNQRVGSVDGWLPDGAWPALQRGEHRHGDEWHDLDEELPIGVGVEKAPQGEGAAVVVAQRQNDDTVVVRAKHFAPSHGRDRVDTALVRRTLRQLASRFPAPQMKDPKTRRPVRGPAVAYDPWAFSESADELDSEGVNMVDFPQSAATMGPATTMTYELATSGRLCHDGDPVLAQHVVDTEAKLTERGMKVMKGDRRPNHSAVAMVMAVAMAMLEAPKVRPRAPRTPVGF